MIGFSDGITLLAATLALANLVVLFGIVRRQRRQHRTLERLIAEVGDARARRSAHRTIEPANPPAPKSAFRVVPK